MDINLHANNWACKGTIIDDVGGKKTRYTRNYRCSDSKFKNIYDFVLSIKYVTSLLRHTFSDRLS